MICRDIHFKGGRSIDRAFTLIELLTVIAIIAVLASLTIGVSAIAARKSKISRTRAEMQRIDLAIRDYKARLGFYPPDNVISPANLTQNPIVNQLFYELSGAVLDPKTDKYQANGGSIGQGIARTDYIIAFGNANLSGIYNSSVSAANTKNFLKGARASQTARVTLSKNYSPFSSFTYTALVVPVAWPASNPKFTPPLSLYSDDPVIQSINPWHYNSTNPTNNPGEFDLWADVVIGDDLVTIGNWKDH